jgi:sugar phosphate isomerase/epimerase
VTTHSLMLEHASLQGQTPETVVAAAVAGGFSLISLHLNGFAKDDVTWIYDDPLKVREFRIRLQDVGVSVAAIDVFPMRNKTRPQDFRAAFEYGASLGARHVLVTCAAQEKARALELVGEIADLAGEYRLGLNLEFARLGTLISIGDAVHLARASGRPNVGVALDILHWARSEGTLADIEAAGPLIRHVQLCDAPAELQAASLMEEATSGRMAPGEGELPVAAALRAAPADALIGVEVCSRPESPAEAIEWARRLGDGCRAVLKASREVQV